MIQTLSHLPVRIKGFVPWDLQLCEVWTEAGQEGRGWIFIWKGSFIQRNEYQLNGTNENSKVSSLKQILNSNVSHSAPFSVLLCSYSKYLFTDYEEKHTTSQDPQQVLTASMGSLNNHGILSLPYYGPFSNVGM